MLPAVTAVNKVRKINFGEVPFVVKLGFGAVLGYGAYKGLKYLIDKAKAGGELTAQQQSIIKPPINPKTGKPITLYDLNGKPITTPVNISIIAQDIYQALHGSVGEDEKGAIRAFKRTPVGYVQQLEKYYLDAYGKNLQNDLAEYLTDTDFMQVKFFFR